MSPIREACKKSHRTVFDVASYNSDDVASHNSDDVALKTFMFIDYFK